MLDLAYFWIGPLGGLVPMPIPETGVDNTLEKLYSEHTSLTANRTVDVHGFRRTWSFSEAWLEPDDVSMLEAFYTKLTTEPLRLIDPLRKNRAFAAPSTGWRKASLDEGLKAFATDTGNGFVTDVLADDTPEIAYTSVGDYREVSYSANRYSSWDVTGTTAPNRLFLNGPMADYSTDVVLDRYVDPVIPGETITYSVFARSGGGATAELHLAPVLEDRTLGTAVVSGASTAAWERLSATYTVPSDGSVIGVVPIMGSSSTAGAVHITHAQLEVGSEPTSWVMGLGTPEVDIRDMSSASPRHPLVTLNLTIREL